MGLWFYFVLGFHLYRGMYVTHWRSFTKTHTHTHSLWTLVEWDILILSFWESSWCFNCARSHSLCITDFMWSNLIRWSALYSSWSLLKEGSKKVFTSHSIAFFLCLILNSFMSSSWRNTPATQIVLVGKSFVTCSWDAYNLLKESRLKLHLITYFSIVDTGYF